MHELDQQIVLVDRVMYHMLCPKEHFFSFRCYMVNTEAHLLVLVVRKKINKS